MVKQVGPALEKADNNLGPRGRFQRLASGARIPSWPGSPGGSFREAGDTFAVRSVLATTRSASSSSNVRDPVRHRRTTSLRARDRQASSLRSDRAPRGSGLDRLSARNVSNAAATANGWLRHRVPITNYPHGPPRFVLL